MIPCRSGAALVSIVEPQRVIAELPLDGRMRASCITDERVLTLNAKGRLFVADVARR